MIVAITFLSVLLVFMRITAPRCFTCRKQKMQMHFTDQLDCVRCHIGKQK